MQYSVLRLLFQLFERGNYDMRFPPALEYLKAFLDGIPDEKATEDTHGVLRAAARANQNDVTSKVARQQKVIHSGILERRGFLHPKITRDEFVGGSFNPKGSVVGNMRPSRHDLPVSFSRLLSSGRNWASPTPLNMRNAQAAWRWVHVRSQLTSPVNIGNASFSYLLSDQTLVKHNNDLHFTTVGCRWGSAVLKVAAIGQGVYEVGGFSDLTHVDRLGDWTVIPCNRVAPHELTTQFPQLGHCGVVLVESGPPISLLHHFLLTKASTVDFDQLSALGAFVGLPSPAHGLRGELLQLFAHHIAAESSTALDADALLEAIKAADATVGAERSWDPMLEVLYEELGDVERGDFSDLGKSIERQKRDARNYSHKPKVATITQSHNVYS